MILFLDWTPARVANERTGDAPPRPAPWSLWAEGRFGRIRRASGRTRPTSSATLFPSRSIFLLLAFAVPVGTGTIIDTNSERKPDSRRAINRLAGDQCQSHEAEAKDPQAAPEEATRSQSLKHVYLAAVLRKTAKVSERAWAPFCAYHIAAAIYNSRVATAHEPPGRVQTPTRRARDGEQSSAAAAAAAGPVDSRHAWARSGIFHAFRLWPRCGLAFRGPNYAAHCLGFHSLHALRSSGGRANDLRV
ncbi:Hypothetical predicted protein [Olea europaea subsp. europaea]|uniref:Uncharacterized protein n=1 Tax=Olea europaea subsp. europaea TaxID=158383 RepID=A0A8S0ULC2_OLEEU|nr:Hypothetical predicted protein [Olea europaea subsp. europaea]